MEQKYTQRTCVGTKKQQQNMLSFITQINEWDTKWLKKSASPAGASAHTENVHFLKPDEEHFSLKEMCRNLKAIKKQLIQKYFRYACHPVQLSLCSVNPECTRDTAVQKHIN